MTTTTNIDPLETEYPDLIDKQMQDTSPSLVCAFNRRGTILASGCADGVVVLWDFETYSVTKRLKPEGSQIGPVTSICWSRDGRMLVVSDVHGRVRAWDVLTGECHRTLQISETVFHLSMDPHDWYRLVVSVVSSNALVISIRHKQPTIEDLPVVRLDENNQPIVTAETPAAASSSSSSSPSKKKKSSQRQRDEVNELGVFDRRGELVVTGSNTNTLTAYDAKTLEPKKQLTISGGAAVKQIVFSRDNAYFLTNSSDRTLRICSTKTFVVMRELQDVVNRLQWSSCALSSNSDFVIAVASRDQAQQLFIWNRVYGQLVKILDGPKDNVNYMAYHPEFPIMVTCGGTGMLYVWSKSYAENWSAFAPDFEQLDENVEYIEREDEFDLVTVDRGAAVAAAAALDADNNDTAELEEDLFTIDEIDVFSDCENELIHLPVVPVPDSELVAAVGASSSSSSSSSSSEANNNKRKKRRKIMNNGNDNNNNNNNNGDDGTMKDSAAVAVASSSNEAEQ